MSNLDTDVENDASLITFKCLYFCFCLISFKSDCLLAFCFVKNYFFVVFNIILSRYRVMNHKLKKFKRLKLLFEV